MWTFIAVLITVVISVVIGAGILAYALDGTRMK